MMLASVEHAEVALRKYLHNGNEHHDYAGYDGFGIADRTDV
jgi:hypothetical protein